MKRICGFLGLSLMVVSLAIAQGTEPEASAPATAEAAPAASADDPRHDELRKLAAAMEDALNKRDLDGLLANVDEDLSFTSMNAESGYGKQHVRDYFDKMMNGPNKIVEDIKVKFVPDKLSVFYGPDVAVSAGNCDSHYELTNGMKFDVTARWTATLVRKDGRWLVASFHYSANMFDNPVLDSQRKFLMLAGGGGALVLAIIGFFIGRKTGRRTA